MSGSGDPIGAEPVVLSGPGCFRQQPPDDGPGEGRRIGDVQSEAAKRVERTIDEGGTVLQHRRANNTSR